MGTTCSSERKSYPVDSPDFEQLQKSMLADMPQEEYMQTVTENSDTIAPAPGSDPELWSLAAQVKDPEIPVLSIADLGILRAAHLEGNVPVITITPTYSGCPAMETITADLTAVFLNAGYQEPRVDLVLSPAWSTDWMSESGKEKLARYGIAPPTGYSQHQRTALNLAVKCPRCHSLNTREMTRFGSTSCKALYQCNSCKEPFDYFKVH